MVHFEGMYHLSTLLGAVQGVFMHRMWNINFPKKIVILIVRYFCSMASCYYAVSMREIRPSCRLKTQYSFPLDRQVAQA